MIKLLKDSDVLDFCDICNAMTRTLQNNVCSICKEKRYET